MGREDKRARRLLITINFLLFIRFRFSFLSSVPTIPSPYNTRKLVSCSFSFLPSSTYLSQLFLRLTFTTFLFSPNLQISSLGLCLFHGLFGLSPLFLSIISIPLTPNDGENVVVLRSNEPLSFSPHFMHFLCFSSFHPIRNPPTLKLPHHCTHIHKHPYIPTLITLSISHPHTL